MSDLHKDVLIKEGMALDVNKDNNSYAVLRVLKAAWVFRAVLYLLSKSS